MVWLALPPATVERIMGETGPVERVTAASYAACALAIGWARLPGDGWRTTSAAAVMLAAFCARELDWHKAFTGTSVLRLSWYGGPASVGAKGVAALVLLVGVAALDRSVSILEVDFGVGVSLAAKALRAAFEEWCELALSLLVAFALLPHRRERGGG